MLSILWYNVRMRLFTSSLPYPYFCYRVVWHVFSSAKEANGPETLPLRRAQCHDESLVRTHNILNAFRFSLGHFPVTNLLVLEPVLISPIPCPKPKNKNCCTRQDYKLSPVFVYACMYMGSRQAPNVSEWVRVCVRVCMCVMCVYYAL